MRKLVPALMMTAMLAFAGPSHAESMMKEIFQDAFYGGLTGALVGGAVVAFTEKPGTHLDYIGYGAAVGVLGGAGFGFIQGTKSLATVENGKFSFNVPTITPDFKVQEENNKTQRSVGLRAELLRGTF